MERGQGRGRRAPLRIACFWNEARSLDRISFRHEHLLRGFAALGHSPTLVTARPWIGSFAGPQLLVDDLAELARPEFWRHAGFAAAVGLTWLRKTALLEALAAAGVPSIALADSDGQIGFAAHPAISWARIGPYQRTARERARAGLYFARRYVASRHRRDPEDRDFVASARASTAIAFASAEAIACFRRFLAQQGAAELAARAFVAPFPVPEEFCSAALPAKQDRLVAIGRWSDPQKDAPLLAGALDRLLRRRRTTRVTLYGADGTAAFAALAARRPAVEIAGERPPGEIRAALAESRAAIVASRWETGPHAAFEALALGATLVGPPLPNLRGLTAGGRFGTLAADRRPGSLARALAEELARWDRGERDGPAIAGHWRPELSATAVCRRLLAALPGSAT